MEAMEAAAGGGAVGGEQAPSADAAGGGAAAAAVAAAAPAAARPEAAPAAPAAAPSPALCAAAAAVASAGAPQRPATVSAAFAFEDWQLDCLRAQIKAHKLLKKEERELNEVGAASDLGGAALGAAAAATLARGAAGAPRAPKAKAGRPGASATPAGLEDAFAAHPRRVRGLYPPVAYVAGARGAVPPTEGGGEEAKDAVPLPGASAIAAAERAALLHRLAAAAADAFDARAEATGDGLESGGGANGAPAINGATDADKESGDGDGGDGDAAAAARRAAAAEARVRLRAMAKALRLAPLQARLRRDCLGTQAWVAQLGERDYRRFVRGWQRDAELGAAAARLAHRSRLAPLARECVAVRRSQRERASGGRELRAKRHKEVALYHSRAERAHAKSRELDHKKMMEALKANNIEAYREMLLQQAPAGGEGALDTTQRAEALEGFLAQTERYVSTISQKVAAVKMQQQIAEAATKAAEAAAAKGLEDEEVAEEGRRAAEEAAAGLAGGEAASSAAGAASDSASYYGLAHSEKETITEQPKMLLLGKLRPYQMVGLQWMVSLYNNRLNGILADEMGLGKTAQTLALIAYLMENKGNYGPHLIIVPNAVVINWKGEIQRWLGNAVSTLIYVGNREERLKLLEDVSAPRFNIMVTSYDFVMRDRARLSRVEWKYIVIDEAQRMKDRESRLSRDLDRFSSQRRLLLTGTPLQNDLMELWSLLNLLLPDVFDSAGWFADWFAKTADPDEASGEDAWLEQEKRTIVVHRLHQILEPFMLRRLVEDVEKRLPPKVPHVVHCRMSGWEAYVYQWVKWTTTVRVDPSMAYARPLPPGRNWTSLQNRCMELRKACNHPWLTASRGPIGGPPAAPHRGVAGPATVMTCGKLHVLDRMLVKLKASGHRVLLFSTMTKMLDILEDYVTWRFGARSWLRIDGSTALTERETAINEFNAPNSRVFMFLLSIKAAGRGLNLQTSDTVIMYDPDPNPKAEEQAVARSHRIGQTREVRVFYMEALAPADPSWMGALGAGAEGGPDRTSGAGASGGESAEAHAGALGDQSGMATNGARGAGAVADMDVDGGAADDLAGGNADDCADGADGGAHGGRGSNAVCESIEGIVRNTIQKRKIEMAEEIIDAGKFDLNTSAGEKKDTLEKLLQAQAEGKAEVRVLRAPGASELNRMLARNDRELRDFEAMDRRDEGWMPPLLTPSDVPMWLRPSRRDLVAALMDRANAGKGVKAGTLGEHTEAIMRWAQEEHARSGRVAGLGAIDAELTGFGRGLRGAASRGNLSGLGDPQPAAEAVDLTAVADEPFEDAVFPDAPTRESAPPPLGFFDPKQAELSLARFQGRCMPEHEHAAIEAALTRLRMERSSRFFARVPTRREDGEYYHKVFYPIDLAFIEDELARGRYANPGAVVADLHTMLGNAELYYEAGSSIVAAAAEMRAAVERVAAELLSREELEAARLAGAKPAGANDDAAAAAVAVPLPQAPQAGSKKISAAAVAAARQATKARSLAADAPADPPADAPANASAAPGADGGGPAAPAADGPPAAAGPGAQAAACAPGAAGAAPDASRDHKPKKEKKHKKDKKAKKERKLAKRLRDQSEAGGGAHTYTEGANTAPLPEGSLMSDDVNGGDGDVSTKLGAPNVAGPSKDVVTSGEAGAAHMHMHGNGGAAGVGAVHASAPIAASAGPSATEPPAPVRRLAIKVKRPRLDAPAAAGATADGAAQPQAAHPPQQQ